MASNVEALGASYFACLTVNTDLIDPQGARVVRLFAVNLDLFPHFSFAHIGICHLPGLALVIDEDGLSALFCAARVARGLVGILLYAFLVTNDASHVSSLAFVTRKEEWVYGKNKSDDAN